MLLKKMGFFRELEHGDVTGPCLKDLVCSRSHENDARLLAYLREAAPFVVSPGVVTDVLSGTEEIIGALAIQTDGVWAWPSDLVYYVEKYHVQLPRDFVEHVRERGYVLPPEGEISSENLVLPPEAPWRY